MGKFAFSLLALLALVSCRSSRSLEGNSFPIFLTRDSSFSTNTTASYLSISYPILKDLKGGVLEDTDIGFPGTTRIEVKRPTMISLDNRRFLLYPNEKLVFKKINEAITVVTANGVQQRDRELTFFHIFDPLQIFPNKVIVSPDLKLDSILRLEQEQKKYINNISFSVKARFDSVNHALAVSEKFKKLSWNYVNQHYQGSLLWFYSLYAAELKYYGLYEQKLREMIPQFNAFKTKEDFNDNVRANLNALVDKIFPGNDMWSMRTQHEFEKCFDSVKSNFNELSREYLLSRLMYRAYTRGIHVSSTYKKEYNKYIKHGSYRKIIRNARRQGNIETRRSSTLPNKLIPVKTNSEVDLESVLKEQRGKLVLIDLWASWCGPCLTLLPAIEQVVKKYPKEKLVLISISLDNAITPWRTAVEKHGLATEHSYLLKDAVKTSFYKQYAVRDIPRFILIGPDGGVLNEQTALPGDPNLENLLDMHLK